MEEVCEASDEGQSEVRYHSSGSLTELSAEVSWRRASETNEELKAFGLDVSFESLRNLASST